jgi:hypothetical protein
LPLIAGASAAIAARFLKSTARCNSSFSAELLE